MKIKIIINKYIIIIFNVLCSIVDTIQSTKKT